MAGEPLLPEGENNEKTVEFPLDFSLYVSVCIAR